MRVLNNNVLVRDIKPLEENMSGGLHLPDREMMYGMDETASSRRYDPDQGIVEDVGPDCEHIKKGDKVILAPLKGKEYSCNGIQFKIYKYAEIFGVIQ